VDRDLLQGLVQGQLLLGRPVSLENIVVGVFAPAAVRVAVLAAGVLDQDVLTAFTWPGRVRW
jgi:hypothetical protein